MQSVSTDFENNSKKPIRNPSFEFQMDWDLDGDYDNESQNVKRLEVERIINEPLGGVAIAQFDVLLSNVSKRYTPGLSTVLANLIKIGRRMDMKLGFNDVNIPIGRGISEYPEINELRREAKIHFYDELENLANFKLSEGNELYTNIRTDLYIWEVLDAVYENHYTEIANMDTGESWAGDGSYDTVNQRGGDRARKLESVSASLESSYLDISTLDLSSYSDTDQITLFVYIEDITKVDLAKVRFHKVVDDTYGDLDLTNYDLQDGWNTIRANKEDIVGIDTLYPPNTWFTIGTSDIAGSDVIPSGIFDWSGVVRVELLLQATSGQNVYAIFDEIRIVDEFNYPARIFDVGLQNITVAAFSGNTALYEIQVAAESEGARFYADELGQFHFENRQHYNDPQYKISRHEFNFSRILELEYPEPENDIVNSVNVHLTPRIIVAEKVIWTYGYGQSTQIADGETLEVWASFQDPVPTTTAGLVTPVATTDYTANDNSDGSGTDRTADVDIAITKFTTGAKLLITNNHTSPVYLTFLQLRGTPAEAQQEVIIKKRDQTSIDEFGEQPVGGMDIDSKYLSSIDYANTLAQQIIDWYAQPIDRVTFKVPALPHLQIGDMISVRNDYIGETFLMRIIGLKYEFSLSTGLKQVITARSIGDFELLTFFEVGTSSIESTDVIAP